MSARQAVLCFLVAGLAPGIAIRTSSKGGELNRTEVQNPVSDCDFRSRAALAQVGQPGMVDLTYTWGAPGCASPSLQNMRMSEPACFPGLRVWHEAGDRTWMGIGTDFVAFALNHVFYAHADMDAKAYNVWTKEMTFHSCSRDTRWEPRRTALGSTSIHYGPLYAETAASLECDMWAHLALMATNKSYIHDPEEAAEAVKAIGWRLAGYATHDGSGSTAAGPQVSHLFQNPDTLECALTFMGTDNWNDWVSNMAMGATKFCGFTYEDERCGSLAHCSVRKERGSFTHWGFTDRLRKITQTEEWANNIQSNLPFCHKLYAMGHSAGGAMAELFTGCVANTLQPGEYGYESDHQYMGFIKQNPRRLNYL